MPDRRDGKIALGTVDDLLRQELAARFLQYALAAVGEFQLRRAGRGQLHQFVVEEGHAGLQAPGHGHVVDPLHGVVDEHDVRVEPQRRVQGGLRAGHRHVLPDEAARDVVPEQHVRLEDLRDVGVRTVEVRLGVPVGLLLA